MDKLTDGVLKQWAGKSKQSARNSHTSLYVEQLSQGFSSFYSFFKTQIQEL